MDKEVLEDQEAVERTEEQINADFEFGRNAAKGIVENPAVEVVDSGEETDQEDAGADASAEPEAIVLAGLTERELKEVLAKANELDNLKASFGSETQKIYGKFGEVQRALKQLSSGNKMKLGEGGLPSLREEYPDLADALIKDLSEVSLGGATPFDSTELEQKFANKVDELSHKMELKVLSIKHPDFKEKTATPDYKLWLGSLPVEKRQAVMESDDGLFVSKALDDFDSWRERGKKKTNRLDRAITPRGMPPEPSKKVLSAEAAFEAGRKATKRRLGILR